MDIALPEAIHEEALLAADVGEEDIRLADEAVQSALAAGERAFKMPEVLRKELLERLDLEARVPSCEGAIASYSPGSMTPGSNAGLKHFTLRMAEIIHNMGQTTYNDIADALLSDLNSADVQAEEKNVRRRIYDALNVLEAIGVVQKGSKNIKWVGWPAELNQAGGGLRMGEMAIARLFARRDALLQKLTTRLEKNQQQAVKLLCLCNLINRNKDAILPLLLAAQKGGYDAPNPFPVPFMMILAPETAKTDVFISDDARRAEIIFNDGVRYDVYDDCGVLQLMGLGVPTDDSLMKQKGNC